MMLARLAVTIVLATAAAGAFAQAYTPRVDQRQANQDRRIDQGAQSGALTAREAGRLDAGQERVERIEDRAKADGIVTRRERVKLHSVQNVQSKRIWKQKHDRQQEAFCALFPPSVSNGQRDQSERPMRGAVRPLIDRRFRR